MNDGGVVPPGPPAAGSDRAQTPELSLRSEFGWVVVGLDSKGNSPRLRVHAPRTGRTVLLDPLEVESLTQWRHEDLVRIVLSEAYAQDVHGPGDPNDLASLDTDLRHHEERAP